MMVYLLLIPNFCHTGRGERVDENNNVHICSRIYSVQCCHDSSHHHLCQIQVSIVPLLILILSLLIFKAVLVTARVLGPANTRKQLSAGVS